MIEERELQNNKYFTKMWETRKRFIPIYYKHDFFPFIQTTSRSEATNARFKDNVGPTYSIISFLGEYQRIIDTIDKAENLEDHYSNQKNSYLATPLRSKHKNSTTETYTRNSRCN